MADPARVGRNLAKRIRSTKPVYCSARAEVLALTKCMALELAPRIRVNAVTPGRIETTELRARYGLDDEGNRARLTQDIPLGRFGEPTEVAEMILYLADSGR